MKTLLLRIRFLVILMALCLLALVPVYPAFAQVTTNFNVNSHTVRPRQFTTQQTHYVRGNINYTMCTQVSNACAVKFTNAALPYNAIILRINIVVFTAFNSTTSDTVKVGISTSGNELVSSGVSLQSTGITAATLASNTQSVIGNSATQTGDNGGFNIYALWTAGTGNTATAGNADVIIEYIAPNDGVCTQVPLGATAAGC